MEAKNFISKLKANGISEDVTDLIGALTEYKLMIKNLSAKERSLFALNVFCVLCRNLEKVPSWCGKIDYKSLLDICIQCVRDSKSLSGEQSLKVLGCIYHLQKRLVHEKTKIPPEVVIKSSFLAFEEKSLIENYGKTYWNVIVDRLSYIERLKNNKTNIIKLLDSIVQDVIKIIQIYETYDFISNFLQFLVKKLYFLYSDFHSPRLSKAYATLFEAFSQKKDSEKLKKLKDKELADVYAKINNCILVIAENDNRNAFKNSILNSIVKCCMSLLGRYESVFHMYQTYHLNFLCSLLTEQSDSKFIETIFRNMSKTFDLSEKMGYKTILDATVPFLYQVMKLFIEYIVGNVNNIQWTTSFNAGAQLKCMQFVAILMPKLCKGTQIVKCENCTVKSGLHDTLRLSFLTKNFITTSLNEQIDLTDIMPEYYNMLIYQLNTIDELSKLKCVNTEKCYKKIQTDIHNTAILLNKHTYYEYSIKLFNLYLKNELKSEANELDYKNISRAFYNKAICELDNKLYKPSIISAGLSQLFAFKDEANDKQMGLIIDVKAKQLNVKKCDDEIDLQNVSLLDIYNMAVNDTSYGDLKRFFGDVKFSSLLHHEFSVYARLWPSIQPVGGVWKSVWELAQRRYPELLMVENVNDVLWVLYEIVLKTTSTVKSIHNEVFQNIIQQIMKNFEKGTPTTLELRIIHSTLKIIQGEYDLKNASEKRGWKVDTNTNPDKTSYSRSVNDEYEALKNILEAVTLWNDLAPALIKSKNLTKGGYIADVLNMLEIGALELLNCCKLLEGLQLAHIGCVLAQNWGHKVQYIRSASLIVYYARCHSPPLNYMMKSCVEYMNHLGHQEDSINCLLIYVCNCAMYFYRLGSYQVSVQLVQYVQSRILDIRRTPHLHSLNLDMSIGHLLEAQTMLCRDVRSHTLYSSVVTAQRHLLNITTTASSFHCIRYSRLLRLAHISHLSILAVNISAQLQMWRRASATAACVPILSALDWVKAQAGACNTSFGDEAMNTIESLVENVINIDSGPSEKQSNQTKSNIRQPPPITINSKPMNVTDDCDLNLNVTKFNMADFLKHDSNCRCYVCETPFIYILTSKLYNLKAGTYFKQKQHEIARNFFDGALASIGAVENKLKVYRKNNSKLYETYLLDIVEKIYKDDFLQCEVELLIDAAFFEISQHNFHALDDHVVRIHEIKQEYTFDKYLNGEVYNLLLASATIKNSAIKTDTAIHELEKEMSSIQLSPNGIDKIMKTPENKSSQPPKTEFNKVANEEVPKVLPRPIKIDLESDTREKEYLKLPKSEFKVPVPNIDKPSLESMPPFKTPRAKEVFKTPMTSKLITIQTFEEFKTPKSDSPEQFFTPITSIKSYDNSKKRNFVAVNLNEGFSLDNEIQNDENNKMKSKEVEKKSTNLKKKFDDKENSNIKNKSAVIQKKSTIIEKRSAVVEKSTEIKKNFEDKDNGGTNSKTKTGARPKVKSSLQKITVEKAKSTKVPDSVDRDGKSSRTKSQSSPVKAENGRPIRRLKPPNKY